MYNEFSRFDLKYECMVVEWLAILPHNNEGREFKPWLTFWD